MNCLKCNQGDTKVYDSRVVKTNKAIRRRRECLECGYRFTTVEEPKTFELNVLKRNGQIKPFSEEKLESGIRKAFNKRPVEAGLVEELSQQVLEDVLALDQNPISSVKVGKMALKRLKEADKVAFICYSAMFSNFESVEDFIKIIN